MAKRLNVELGFTANTSDAKKQINDLIASLQKIQTIPSNMESRDNTTKYILRKTANEVLPDEWATRPKWGFPVPFHYWIREDKYYNKVKELFNEDFVSEFFKVDYLNKLLDDHKNEKKQNGRKIYVIYTFLIWYKVYFINEV